MSEFCVMCGREIPEGRQVCKICEDRVMNDGKLRFVMNLVQKRIVNRLHLIHRQRDRS